VVSFTTRPLYPQGRSPRYPLGRRLDGPQGRSGLGVEEKKPCPYTEPIPGLPARSLVTILSELSRLMCLGGGGWGALKMFLCTGNLHATICSAVAHLAVVCVLTFQSACSSGAVLRG